MSDENASLGDFGIGGNVAPPRIQRDHRVSAREPGQTAGWVGPIPNRNVYGFAKVGTKADDRLYDPDGHALNDIVLSRVRSHGAQIVLAVELDTKDVLEWPIREFVHDVPSKISKGQGEQTYAKAEHATVWEDHADDLWIDDDVNVTHGYETSHDWE